MTRSLVLSLSSVADTVQLLGAPARFPFPATRHPLESKNPGEGGFQYERDSFG